MNRQSTRGTWLCGFLLVGSALAGGCTGSVDLDGDAPKGAAEEGDSRSEPDVTGSDADNDKGSDTDRDGTPTASGKPPKGGQAGALKESAGALPLTRLTHREYANTMVELLGDATKQGSKFEADIPGLTGYDAPTSVATENARQYMAAAESLSKGVVGKSLKIPCTAPATPASEASCVSKLIADFATRAYRRPLLKEEADGLLAVFQKGRELGFGFEDAVTAMVEAVLQSPNLLYHRELGDQVPKRDKEDASLVQLTPHQLASRLSYFLWESPPDAELLRAAESGELETVEGVKTQAERMLKDEKRARRALFNFHRQWLKVDNLEDLDPGTNLGLLLGQELEEFVASVVLQGDGKLNTLLTAPYTFVNEVTAKEYGLTAKGAAFERVALDPEQRRGVLMQVPFLRTNGVAPPVARGIVVYRQLLCGEVPPPPPDVPEVEEDAAKTHTTRELFAVHTQKTCARGCHALFDPWGFAFENFDSLGRYRTKENGKTVDPSGLPQEGGVIGGTTPESDTIPFKSALEMVDQFASSEEVSLCVAKQWTRYMLGRFETDGELGAIMNAYSAASGGEAKSPGTFSVREFLVALVTTKAFRFRTLAAGEML